MNNNIQEKEITSNVKLIEDTKKDRFSTKVLITLTAGVILALLTYGIATIFKCGLNSCYLGGAGIGSVIVTVIWLIFNSLKP